MGLADPTGCSQYALENYITTHYKSCDFKRYLLRAAIKRGLEKGTILIHHNHKNSYKLPPKSTRAPAPKKKPAKKKAPAKKKKKVTKKKKTTKKKVTKKKTTKKKAPKRKTKKKAPKRKTKKKTTKKK